MTVHVGPTPGYTSAGRHDAYTGNGFGKNAAWHLEAQEIPADYQLYHFKSGAGPDGRSSGVVNGRTLKFKKLYKDSRLRLFYSDNLRSYSGSYASCRWTIRVDGQACKSGNIAGDVYVHPYDNPLRPRSFAGYCDDVSVGEHTVDVFIGTTPGYSSCGGHTGWTGSGGGAHYLLEAEEIPNPSSYPMLHYKMAHTSDGRDAGALAHYQLSFEKKNKETTLRLFLLKTCGHTATNTLALALGSSWWIPSTVATWRSLVKSMSGGTIVEIRRTRTLIEYAALRASVKTFPQGRTKLWLTCGKEALRTAIATRGGSTVLGAMVPTESWKCTSSSSLALASRKAIAKVIVTGVRRQGSVRKLCPALGTTRLRWAQHAFVVIKKPKKVSFVTRTARWPTQQSRRRVSRTVFLSAGPSSW